MTGSVVLWDEHPPEAAGEDTGPTVLPRDSLRHWHPLLRSADLGRRPVERKLFGQEIAVFRDASGTAHAVDNRCPHRNMRLALGRVDGDRLVCPYHGWRVSGNGDVSSPGAPRMRLRTGCYALRESDGMLWVRDADAPDVAPVQVSFQGYRPVAIHQHLLAAPLHALLDNMMELEHTAAVHGLFGFDSARLHEVKTRVTQAGPSIGIYYEGPQRKLPLHYGLATGLREGDLFIQDALVSFAPVHAVYDLRWFSPQGERRPFELKFVVFFNEVDERNAVQFSFAFAKVERAIAQPFLWAVLPLLGASIDEELGRDIRLVEQLDLPPGADSGFRYSRFDQPLLLRRRLYPAESAR